MREISPLLNCQQCLLHPKISLSSKMLKIHFSSKIAKTLFKAIWMSHLPLNHVQHSPSKTAFNTSSTFLPAKLTSKFKIHPKRLCWHIVYLCQLTINQLTSYFEWWTCKISQILGLVGKWTINEIVTCTLQHGLRLHFTDRRQQHEDDIGKCHSSLASGDAFSVFTDLQTINLLHEWEKLAKTMIGSLDDTSAGFGP